MADVPNYQVAIPDNATFRLEQIGTSVRCPDGSAPADGSSGLNCPATYDPNGTTKLLHWADIELAEGWRQWIQQIANGVSDPMLAKLPSGAAPATPAQIAFITSYAGKSDAELLRTNKVRTWLANMLGAIANYYNALNLPWSSDPQGRGLYRKFFSGNPGRFNAERPQDSDEFNPDQDYNAQWYTANAAKYPIINRHDAFASRDAVGLLPTALVNAFKGRNPGAAATHALEYRRTAGLQLVQAPSPAANTRGWPLSSADKTNDPVFAPQIANWAFVDVLPSDAVGAAYRTASMQIQTAQFNPWWEIPFATNFDCAPDAAARHAAGLDATQCDGGHFGQNDSQTIASSYAWAVPGIVADTSLAAASPLVQYLAWVRQWAETIISRDPHQVIIDTRKYAVFVNTVLSSQYNNMLFEAAGTSISEAARQQHQGDPNIAMAASAIAAIGAALSTATYGISAIIGAVVGAGMMIADTVMEHQTHGLHKDDMGQWKPAFLRGWLGGKIAGVVSTENVSPSYIPVALPYGFTRGAAPTTRTIRFQLPNNMANMASLVRANAQTTGGSTALLQNYNASFQALTPEQITQIIGPNDELCAAWGALTTEEKRARLVAVGYNGDDIAARAVLDNRCGQIASEIQTSYAAEVVAPPPSTTAKVLPWLIGGAVVAAGGTAVYFAMRKRSAKQGPQGA